MLSITSWADFTSDISSRFLTVRNTDASSRMTEYTSPLLFIETCGGRENTPASPLQDHLSKGDNTTSQLRKALTHTRRLNQEGFVIRCASAYWWSVVHHQRTQSPGEAQTQQDVKDIAAYGVRHRHVPHAWGERATEKRLKWGERERACNDQSFFFFLPCRATIRLAMQSGTLVPAARKVMPMM